MASKYPKDPQGRNILGTQYGIQITRPWNNSMYMHNDTIAEIHKGQISKALTAAYNDDNLELVKKIAKCICGYGHGGNDIDYIFQDAEKQLEMTQNYWLHETYPDMVKKGYVPEISQHYVGYDKI